MLTMWEWDVNTGDERTLEQMCCRCDEKSITILCHWNNCLYISRIWWGRGRSRRRNCTSFLYMSLSSIINTRNNASLTLVHLTHRKHLQNLASKLKRSGLNFLCGQRPSSLSVVTLASIIYLFIYFFIIANVTSIWTLANVLEMMKIFFINQHHC